jgi:hypothetical protein
VSHQTNDQQDVTAPMARFAASYSGPASSDAPLNNPFLGNPVWMDSATIRLAILPDTKRATAARKHARKRA